MYAVEASAIFKAHYVTFWLCVFCFYDSVALR